MNIKKEFKAGAKQCSIDELLFPVDINDNSRKTNREYSRVVTGIINDEEVDLNYCSSAYTLVKNKDIFPKIEQALFNNAIDLNVKYYHINHARFYADYLINDKRYEYNINDTSDTIFPIIRVQHSYNGLTKYKIIFGYYRVVCSNGLTIPVKEMEQFNLCIVGKHTNTIINSFKRLNDMLYHFINEAETITKQITTKYELLAGRQTANPQNRIESVLKANSIIAVDNSKFNTVNDIMQRIMNEQNKLSINKVNDWLIYNGINQYLNDDNRNIALPEIRREKDLKVLEFMLHNE